MTGHATSVALLPGTRPLPVFRGFTQPRFHRVLFHVPDDFLAFIAISHPTIKITLRPKGSGTLQDPVRLECRPTLDPCYLPRKGVLRLLQQMDVVWHEHIRSQVVPSGQLPLPAELLLRHWPLRVSSATVVHKAPHPAVCPLRQTNPPISTLRNNPRRRVANVEDAGALHQYSRPQLA